MPTTLFLQSDIQDPYVLYESMLHQHPVYWDEENHLWAIYSYQNSKLVLQNTAAQIPSINKDSLNEYALLITRQLTRLRNGAEHEIARHIAMLLFDKMHKIPINNIFDELIQNDNRKNEIDWVNSICKKLPAIVVLKSFDFKDEDCDYVTGAIEQLAKIMLPVKTRKQLNHINQFTKETYILTEKHLLSSGIALSIIKSLSEKYKIPEDEVVSLCTSNLVGLFIQSHDAGRGILSNSLLQILKNKSCLQNISNETILKKCIIETLRFDPPIHNTRREAIDDIILENFLIKKGSQILVVLASANRDARQFENPNKYNIERSNNGDHLAFGFGNHSCIAKQFSLMLATETLSYFFRRYQKVNMLETDIQYEPMMNARLPKNMSISFS